MIKLKFLLFVFILIILLNSCFISENSFQLNKDDKTLDWLYYDGAEFSLYYPKNWEIDTSKNLETELILHSFMDETDNFRDNITIEKYQKKEPLSKEKLVEKIQKRLDESNAIWHQEFTNTVKNKHYYCSFYILLKKEELSIILYVFFNEKSVYILNFTQKINYTELEKTAEKIMQNFALK